jgi:hypothetical protein
MQKAGEPLRVTLQEAANRAAALGGMHFHVRSIDHIIAPFGYLAYRHIQARKKLSLLLNISAWLRQSIGNRA